MTEATMAAIPAPPVSPRRTARRLMLLGGGVLVALAFIALAAPLIAPLRSGDDRGQTGCSAPPEFAHLLGSDVLGRDVLSRVIYGLRASLLVSISAVLGSLALAVPLGLLAGYFGRWVDSGDLARPRPDPGLPGHAAGDHLHRHSRAGQRDRRHRHRGDLPADPRPRDADEHADRVAQRLSSPGRARAARAICG